MRFAYALVVCLGLGACTKEVVETYEPADADSDGYNELVDCDDGDAAIYPGADEVCDGVDNDCDYAEDEDPLDGSTWYLDADQDGYGDPYESVVACTQPPGHVADATDCDDDDDAFHPGATEDDCTDPNDYDCDGEVIWTDADGDGWAACEDCDDEEAGIHPGAVEVCDGVDNDCDEVEDGADALDAEPFYRDEDSDGYGLVDDVVWGCDAPSGYVADATDCDDKVASVYPGADEQCNGVDDDCDGVDDEDPVLGQGFTYYLDVDGDGYGNDSVSQRACNPPEGYQLASGDCDDLDVDAYPDNAEVCDGVDNDCNDLIDDEASDAITWYLDADEDGYGDATSSTDACEQPSGYVLNAEDCDDEHDTAHPGRVEVCDELDNDCDDSVDEDDAVDAATWFHDFDGDGYGDPGDHQLACEQPDDFVADDSDCDDAIKEAYPGAPELCNGEDDDCDGAVDEEATDRTTWYLDADDDGQGGEYTLLWCDPPPDGYVDTTGDCDDLDPEINTDADEVCDGIDNDCNDEVDDEAIDEPTWYYDEDGDGWGVEDSPVESCVAPGDASAVFGDCAPTDDTTYPGADELCDEVSHDCDGELYEDAVDAGTWYADLDGDGHGTVLLTTVACTAPTGFVDSTDDCNDGNPTTYPGADELCDGVDNDCLGDVDEADAVDAPTWYEDWDSDGFGDSSVSMVSCEQPDGYVADDTDCSDIDGTTYPGADELCDAVNHDCTGDTTTGAVDGDTWYADLDGDGHGTTLLTTSACSAPSGYVDSFDDCNDGHPLAYPGADELCDGVDNDCLGDVDEADAVDAPTWYDDFDGDGFGDAGDSLVACDRPVGHVADSTDCNDGNVAIHPAAPERCNGVNDDCDSATDEADAVDAPTWYHDYDGDDFGDPGDPQDACSQPANHVADATDCDDFDDTEYPGAPEQCDGYDNDCDGVADELGEVYGEGASCAATSCEDILFRRSDSPGDGVYWIDPYFSGAYEVYCDMSLVGGGWTLLAVFTNGDASSSWQPSSSHWVADSTFGAPTDPSTNADAKSTAWDNLLIDQIMVVHWPDDVGLVSATSCIDYNPLQFVFQRASEPDWDCAWSCPTLVRAFRWSHHATYQDSTLKFRCCDHANTTCAGHACSTDDNSFITTLNNTPSYSYLNFGLGAGESGDWVDWDNDAADDDGNDGDTTQVLLFGR